MAHFVRTLSGGYLNLDKIDGIEVLNPATPGGSHLIVAERHDKPNLILGQSTSAAGADELVRNLLGDSIHD